MIIRPPSLELGDTIALVAPASKVDPLEAFRCVKNLQAEGFQVKLVGCLDTAYGYFSDRDTNRAKNLMKAFQDEEVKAIWCLRGGYGSGRILDQLDYQAIRSCPKILIGMSDITALHTAITQRAGLITYLGPNAHFLFAHPEEKERSFAKQHVWHCLQDKNWEKITCMGEETLTPGKAVGALTGGNLSVLASHVGTPWQIDTKDKILLLEDVGEYTYRIDRLLLQLKQATLLDHVAGVVLGHFSDCRSKHAHDFDVIDILKDYFACAPYPVLSGLSSGHIEAQLTLPLGHQADLDATAKTLSIDITKPIKIGE